MFLVGQMCHFSSFQSLDLIVITMIHLSKYCNYLVRSYILDLLSFRKIRFFIYSENLHFLRTRIIYFLTIHQKGPRV